MGPGFQPVGDVSRTAMAVRELEPYGTPGRAAETKTRIERGGRQRLRASNSRRLGFDFECSLK